MMQKHSLLVVLLVVLVTACCEAQNIQKRYAGKVVTEVYANVSSDAVWALYRAHNFATLIVQLMPTTFEDIEYVSGDGAVGTILRLIPLPGAPGGIRLVNITMLDDKTQTRVLTQIQGGLLEAGFTKFETIYKIIKKNKNSCVIRTTVAFRVNAGSENLAANMVPNWMMQEAILRYVVAQQQQTRG